MQSAKINMNQKYREEQHCSTIFICNHTSEIGRAKKGTKAKKGNTESGVGAFVTFFLLLCGANYSLNSQLAGCSPVRGTAADPL